MFRFCRVLNTYYARILQCGLKGFVGNCNSTLDSEVGILGYLSFAHDSDLKFALREMLEVRGELVPVLGLLIQFFAHL